jgi:hypothetical protein
MRCGELRALREVPHFDRGGQCGDEKRTLYSDGAGQSLCLY